MSDRLINTYLRTEFGLTIACLLFAMGLFKLYRINMRADGKTAGTLSGFSFLLLGGAMLGRYYGMM